MGSGQGGILVRFPRRFLWGRPPAGQEKADSQSSTNKNDGRASDDTTDDGGEVSESGRSFRGGSIR